MEIRIDDIIGVKEGVRLLTCSSSDSEYISERLLLSMTEESLMLALLVLLSLFELLSLKLGFSERWIEDREDLLRFVLHCGQKIPRGNSAV